MGCVESHFHLSPPFRIILFNATIKYDISPMYGGGLPWELKVERTLENPSRRKIRRNKAIAN
jgi:hypothetical protein